MSLTEQLAPSNLPAMTVPTTPEEIMDARDISRALERIAEEVIRFSGGIDDLVLIGIQRRGVELAERINRSIAAQHGHQVPLGALDITLYRDDFATIGPVPVVGETRVDVELTERCVVIVDDVLFTGRTVRAALDELRDFGRPARIGLGVLIDRGGRELPIQADMIGLHVEAEPADHVKVSVTEVDGTDQVQLFRGHND